MCCAVSEFLLPGAGLRQLAGDWHVHQPLHHRHVHDHLRHGADGAHPGAHLHLLQQVLPPRLAPDQVPACRWRYIRHASPADWPHLCCADGADPGADLHLLQQILPPRLAVDLRPGVPSPAGWPHLCDHCHVHDHLYHGADGAHPGAHLHLLQQIFPPRVAPDQVPACRWRYIRHASPTDWHHLCDHRHVHDHLRHGAHGSDPGTHLHLLQ